MGCFINHDKVKYHGKKNEGGKNYKNGEEPKYAYMKHEDRRQVVKRKESPLAEQKRREKERKDR